MKSNIDLTEDRDFPDSSNISNISSSPEIDTSIFKFLSIPWKLHLTTSDLELGTLDDTLFLTGTKAQILSKRQIHQSCTDSYCDRCGAKLKNIPWKVSRLCDKCEAELESELKLRNTTHRQKIPWKNKEGLSWT